VNLFESESRGGEKSLLAFPFEMAVAAPPAEQLAVMPLDDGNQRGETGEATIIRLRNEEVRAIAQEAAEVAEAQRALQQVTRRQGELLEAAQDRVAEARDQSDDSVRTLAKAAKSEANQTLGSWGSWVGAGVGGTLGFLSGGPALATVGALAGSQVGSHAGDLAAEQVDRSVDRGQFELALRRRGLWVDDNSSEARLCSACRAEFSTMLRRHHCRACGKVFCYACSSKSLPFALATEGSVVRHERVCEQCFADHWEDARDVATV
jgi:ElaB/YqjD/DUF883 family membrane-anchored ribosome-binding protein